jgi:hypothetical protein
MIPMRTGTIFRNRWMALVWAAGIVWFAYDFAGSQPEASNASANAGLPADAEGAPLTAEDQQRVSDALNAF